MQELQARVEALLLWGLKTRASAADASEIVEAWKGTADRHYRCMHFEGEAAELNDTGKQASNRFQGLGLGSMEDAAQMKRPSASCDGVATACFEISLNFEAAGLLEERGKPAGLRQLKRDLSDTIPPAK